MPHLPSRPACLRRPRSGWRRLPPSGRRRSQSPRRGRQRRPHHRRDGVRGHHPAAASSNQVVRVAQVMIRVRVWRRGSPIACCARCNASTGVGGSDHAGTMDRELARRVSMWVRRVDQRWFSQEVDADESPDRTASGSVPGRSNRTPNVSRRCCSSCVVGFRRGNIGLEQHPTVDGQPPSVEGLHLVRDRDVGVQVRVPARLSRWVNAAATRPWTLTYLILGARSG